MACPGVGPGGIHHGRRGVRSACCKSGISGLQALVCDHGDALAGKLLFRLGEGVLVLGSDGMPAEQPARLTASKAARHTRQKWRSFPRVRIGPNVEPPSV